MQRRIERSFFDAKDFIRHTMDMQRDSVSVHRAVRESAQYEERQRALQERRSWICSRSLLASYNKTQEYQKSSVGGWKFLFGGLRSRRRDARTHGQSASRVIPAIGGPQRGRALEFLTIAS